MSEKKRYWRCHVCNDIHFGVKPPETCPTCGMRNAFVLCDQPEADRIFELARDKNVWRCSRCDDMHLGAKPMPQCSSCASAAKYVSVSREEAGPMMRPVDYTLSAPDEVLAAWDEFVGRNGRIRLWEERGSVQQLSVGVLENVKNKGLKYCPCRVPLDDPVKDLKLICPCNFLAQQTWKEHGECWCGLFRKR